jgi:hypothetical protein
MCGLAPRTLPIGEISAAIVIFNLKKEALHETSKQLDPRFIHNFFRFKLLEPSGG